MGIIDGIITIGESDTAGQNDFSGQSGLSSTNILGMANTMAGIPVQPENKPWLDTGITPQPQNKPWQEGMKPLYMQKLETEGDPIAGVAEYKVQRLKERDQDNVFSGIPGFQAFQLASKGSGVAQAQSSGETMGQGTQAQTGASESQQPVAAGSGTSQPETGGQSVPVQAPATPSAVPPAQRRNRPDMANGDRDPTGGGTAVLTNPVDPESDAIRGKNWEYLSPERKERIRARLRESGYGDMDLDSLKIHSGDRRWFQPPWASGMSLENHIYIDREIPVDPNNPDLGTERFDPDNNPRHFNILLEEIIHSGQYQKGMTRGGYVWDGIRYGYERHPAETEAQGIVRNPPPPVSRPLDR